MSDLRAVSIGLFGHAYRLDLLSALASAGPGGVVLTELARSRGISASVFYPPIHALTDLRLVQRQGPQAGSRRVRYIATTSPAWEPLRALLEYLSAQASSETSANT